MHASPDAAALARTHTASTVPHSPASAVPDA